MVVLTPHWHSEGEPGKHTWSGRSAPPLARLDLPSSPRSERVLGIQGRGRWSLPAESSPSCDTACSAASLVGTARKGPSAPASGAHRPNLGSPPTVQTLPCRWGALGDGGWLRLEGEEADGARCEGKTPSPPPRGRETPRTRRPKAAGSRPGTAGFLHLFDLVYGPVAAAHTLSAARPAATARVGAELTKAWLGPRALLRVAGPQRDPSASPCRLLPSEPHPSRPLTALPLLFWAASQKNGQA